MFIVIEGTDGSGKSTMVQKLYEYCLTTLKSKTIRLKFPNYNSPFGEIITRYLEGNIDKNLNPWIITTLFDCDKFDYKLVLENHLKTNDIIILDRYVLSNMVYSLARMPNESEQTILSNLACLNFDIFKMPIPDITFVLDIDIDNYSKIRDLRKDFHGCDIHENNNLIINKSIEFFSSIQDKIKYMGKIVKLPYVSIEERLNIMVSECMKL